jgi:hypothetical protein
VRQFPRLSRSLSISVPPSTFLQGNRRSAELLTPCRLIPFTLPLRSRRSVAVFLPHLSVSLALSSTSWAGHQHPSRPHLCARDTRSSQPENQFEPRDLVRPPTLQGSSHLIFACQSFFAFKTSVNHPLTSGRTVLRYGHGTLKEQSVRFSEPPQYRITEVAARCEPAVHSSRPCVQLQKVNFMLNNDFGGGIYYTRVVHRLNNEFTEDIRVWVVILTDFYK